MGWDKLPFGVKTSVRIICFLFIVYVLWLIWGLFAMAEKQAKFSDDCRRDGLRVVQVDNSTYCFNYDTDHLVRKQIQ